MPTLRSPTGVRSTVLVAAASIVLGRVTSADPDPFEDPPTESLTSSHLDRVDLDERLGMRPSDLLRYLPGLGVIGQGGGGQADQLLLRGYDAGQGADVGVLVDGVPINLSSHAYAHGYADTHFVIPDSIDSIDLHEGAYAARFGGFASAGVLELHTIDEVPGGAVVRITSGTELTGPLLAERLRRLRYRLVGMASPKLERGHALLAAEVGIDDGPYIHPQRYRRGAALGKWQRPVGDGQVTAAITFYSGRWFDGGPLAQSEIAAGHLTPFSSPDPSQGGTVVRTSASLAYDTRGARRELWHLSGYVVSSDLRLYTNPTLFLRDPTDGSEIEYVDNRTYLGLDGWYRRVHRQGALRVGVQMRSDDALATTWHDARRNRLVECFGMTNPCTDTAPRMRDVAVYTEETLRPTRRVTLLAGARLDEEIWNVDDRDADTMLGATTLGGTGARSRISPKLGAIYRGDELDLAVLGGAGARSTDARASSAASGYGAFVRTYNAEVSARAHPDPRLEAAVAVWWSKLASSEVWLADAGNAARLLRTARHGIEAKLVFAPTDWLAVDASLAISRGTSLTPSGLGDVPPVGTPVAPLPLAPRLIGNGGVAVHRGVSFASLRVRALGARATADPALPTTGYTVVDVLAGRRWRMFELRLTIENLFDTAWREAQFAGDVQSSRRLERVRDLLVTPGVPLTALVTLGFAP